MPASSASWLKALLLVGSLTMVACPKEEPAAEICDNTLDDDGNGLADCADAACAADPVCAPPAVEICGNGADDDANGQTDCEDAACAADPACIVPGDGVRAPGVEQCDDGNLTDGDGCSANMTLEDGSTITVNANSAALVNTTADAATKSIFIPLADAFDVDQDGTPETSLLFVVSTDRADICDVVRDNGGFNGFLDALFGGGVDGTVAISMVQQAGGDFVPGTFTGTGVVLSTPGIVSVDQGYIVTANGAGVSDTTFGSDGLGTAVFAQPSAGNITLDITGATQITQFLPQQATISEPISGSIKAAICLDFVQ